MTAEMTTEMIKLAEIGGAFSSNAGFELAQRVAKGLASSSLVPEAYRGNVPNVLLAMEMANRIRSSIFAVMQHLSVINGKPGFASTFLIATVNSSKRFTPLRFRFTGDTGTDQWGCRAYASDKETGEECIGPLVTMAIAKAEGWYDKKGSKWKTMPELMLHYRSAAFWTRVFAPELSFGMQTVDELQDIAAGQAHVVQEAPGSLKEILAAQEANINTKNTKTVIDADYEEGEHICVGNPPFIGDPSKPTPEEIAEQNGDDDIPFGK